MVHFFHRDPALVEEPPERAVISTQAALIGQAAANEVSAMDFVAKRLFDGSNIRILTIFDAFTWVSLAIGVRRRFRGADVVNTLQRVSAIHGVPKSIRVDQRQELISKDVDLLAWTKDVTLDFSRPRKPTGDAFIESFNGKVRA